MANNNIDPMDINIRNIARKFDVMDNDSVEDLIAKYTGHIVQKELSEAFGVHETTFNGWWKNNKYPDYAKIILGLIKVFEDLKTSHRALTNQINMTMPVDMGNEFGLIELVKDKSGDFQVKIIARGIANQVEAKKLVTKLNAAKLFAESAVDLIDAFDSGSAGGIEFGEDYFEGNKTNPYQAILLELVNAGMEVLHSEGLTKSFINEVNHFPFGSGEDATIDVLNMLREHLSKEELKELEPLMKERSG